MKDILKLIWILLYSLVGWIIVVPLSLLVPKKKNLIICIGRDDGKFVDNVKYMFLHLHSIKEEEGIEPFFLTSNARIFNALQQAKLPTLHYPSWQTYLKLLQAHIIIADNDKWFYQWKYFFFHWSKKVQLWHGSGIKKLKIGMRAPDFPSFRRCLKTPRFLYDFIRDAIGLLLKYDLFTSSSDFFTENYFQKSFKAKKFINTGYPRNDVLLHPPDDLALIEADQKILSRIKELKKHGYKIVLYTPTFRNSQTTPLTDKSFNHSRLRRFAEENKIAFVFKFHPNVKIKYDTLADEGAEGLDLFRSPLFLIYDSYKDLYPCLPLADLLITDYSSIYIDYLFLNRPVVFFAYDIKTYTNKDQDLQFDYNWITPGPKCHTYDALEQEIKDTLVHGKDDYRTRREEIFNISFEHKTGKSAERIWNIIKKDYIIPS